MKQLKSCANCGNEKECNKDTTCGMIDWQPKKEPKSEQSPKPSKELGDDGSRSAKNEASLPQTKSELPWKEGICKGCGKKYRTQGWCLCGDCL